jgi:oligopeptide/dipeptide ABC transporter ATP-binding protein
LEVFDLSTWFHTARGIIRAVDRVSFGVQRGRTLGVVGESGSGKTVLCRSIMGLLPTQGVHRAGRILFEGQDLVAMTPRQLSSLWGAEIAMVFQDPMTSLNPVVRIGRQITESLQHHLGQSGSESKRTAIALLRSVGIPDPTRRFDQYPHQLSGGMRQRVTIAMALACGPKLLLADEPTTALDVTVQAQILDLLGRARAERSMAMILVTHDLGVVAGRADEIAVMYAGRVVEQAPTKKLFANTRMPYTEGLVRSIPRLSAPSHTRLAAIGGRPPDSGALSDGCAFAPRCRYVQDRCRAEAPPLRSDSTPDHRFACWFPLGEPDAGNAVEGNRSRPAPPAGEAR